MKLILSLLVLGAPLLGQDDSRLRDLVDRLRDDDITVRERAAADLADYGPAAIAALEKLRASPDLELRSRISSVLRRIAENGVLAKHWRRGPRITLDFESAPVSRILQELARQARDTFTFDAEQLDPDRATVHVKEATVWEALESVCRAAPALTWEAEGEGLTFTKKRRPFFPARRQDEFQVWLDGITFTRDCDFTGNPRSTFTLGLVSAWEKGISPIAVEQRITEILDQDGGTVPIPDRFMYNGTRLDAPRGRLRRDGVFVPLPLGAKQPKVFSRVRGNATFFFPRTWDELSFDVQATPNPPAVDVQGMTIGVRNFKVSKEACSCELELRIPLGAGDALLDRVPSGEIALVDDQGALHRGRSVGRNQTSNGAFYILHDILQIPFPQSRTAEAVKLRFLKDTLEKRIPFEFSDIALE